jgi:hypothetical protein
MAGGQGNGKRGVSVSWLLFGAKGVKHDRNICMGQEAYLSTFCG